MGHCASLLKLDSPAWPYCISLGGWGRVHVTSSQGTPRSLLLENHSCESGSGFDFCDGHWGHRSANTCVDPCPPCLVFLPSRHIEDCPSQPCSRDGQATGPGQHE